MYSKEECKDFILKWKLKNKKTVRGMVKILSITIEQYLQIEDGSDLIGIEEYNTYYNKLKNFKYYIDFWFEIWYSKYRRYTSVLKI